jgi:hypothetical protein
VIARALVELIELRANLNRELASDPRVSVRLNVISTAR